MQVKELNQSILGIPDWARFLQRSSILIAAVLLGSALIMAIAANWLSWPKVGRVALLQATITALVLLAWWQGQNKPNDWTRAHSLSSLSLNLAAIAVGGVLALIGQSYQTGADPWQLFALWAALLLPWLIAQRSLFIILLVLTLTNIALYLYFGLAPSSGPLLLMFFSFSGAGGAVVVVNLIALGLTHLLRTAFVDPQMVVRRACMLFLSGAVLWWQAQVWFMHVSDGVVYFRNVLCLALMGGLAWWYLRRLQDVLTGAIAYVAVYALAMGLVVYSLDETHLSITTLFFTGASIGAVLIYDLRRAWLQRVKTTPSRNEPWFLRVFYLGVQAIVAFFFMLVWWQVMGRPSDLVVHVYVLVVVAVALFLQRYKNSTISQDLSLFLLSSTVLVVGIGLRDFNPENTWLMAWFMLLGIIVYVFSPKLWLARFVSAGVTSLLFFAAVLGHQQDFFQQLIQLFDGLVTGLLLGLVVLSGWMRLNPENKETVSPLWWAWVMLLVGLVGQQELDLDVIESSSYWLHHAAALLPAVTLFFLLREQHSLVFGLACSGVALGLSWFLLMPIPLANLALAAWVWAYAQRDRVLFWAAVILLAAALGLHYYALDWLLVHKAMALGAGGAWLAAGALLLQRVVTQADDSESISDTATLRPAFYRWVWLGLGAVLLLTTQDIVRKEYLLAKGRSVVLALAPVDPRSLMQGDFMALDFAVGLQVRNLAPQLIDLEMLRAPVLLAYLSVGAKVQSELVALQDPRSGHVLIRGDQPDQWRRVESLAATDLSDTAVLRLQYKQWRWLPNGVDAWFFPEGQAGYFEQAKYGEFKTNAKGQALLFRLLNEKAQPMAAPAQIVPHNQ